MIIVKGAQKHLVEEHASKREWGQVVKALECFVKNLTFYIWPLFIGEINSGEIKVNLDPEM